MYEESFEVSGTVKFETEKAILVDCGDKEIWLPKSQIKNIEEIDCDDDKAVQEIEVPEWLAKEKELI